MTSNASANSQLIKKLAKEHGFLDCGLSKAEFLEDEAPRLELWLSKGMHGKMSYMENHFDMRLNPTLLVPGAKTVVSLLFNYYSEKKQSDPEAPKISMYAYGTDYHFVVKDKLRALVQDLQKELGNFNARVFVDSAPILEKTWAVKSGLGWMGKHGNILSKKKGSFFFLAEIICDLETVADSPVQDHCGTCTKCIDACPTDAIESPYIVNGSKCISYATIELKDEIIPSEFKGKMDNWMFGCDICQQVCPWNRFSTPHNVKEFEPKEELLKMSKADWEEITQEVFQKLFKNSPVKRTKYEGLQRNIRFLME